MSSIERRPDRYSWTLTRRRLLGLVPKVGAVIAGELLLPESATTQSSSVPTQPLPAGEQGIAQLSGEEQLQPFLVDEYGPVQPSEEKIKTLALSPRVEEVMEKIGTTEEHVRDFAALALFYKESGVGREGDYSRWERMLFRRCKIERRSLFADCHPEINSESKNEHCPAPETVPWFVRLQEKGINVLTIPPVALEKIVQGEKQASWWYIPSIVDRSLKPEHVLYVSKLVAENYGFPPQVFQAMVHTETRGKQWNPDGTPLTSQGNCGAAQINEVHACSSGDTCFDWKRLGEDLTYNLTAGVKIALAKEEMLGVTLPSEITLATFSNPQEIQTLSSVIKAYNGSSLQDMYWTRVRDSIKAALLVTNA